MWPTICLFSAPQKDDEIARLRKDLDTRKPRGLVVNTQKNSALEQVWTHEDFVLSFKLEQSQRN